MKRSTKIIWRTFWLALVAIVAFVLITVWQLDKVIATGIRTVGSQMTGTQVSVKNVEVSLFKGKFALEGFAVANPSGFQAENAVAVQKFSVKADLGTITSDKIILDKVEIIGARFDYEYRLSGSNLDVILQNVQKFAGSEDKKVQQESASGKKDKSDAAEKKLVIRKLIIRDAKASVSSRTLRTSMVIPLPTIEMDNVGEGSDKTIADTIEEIVTTILEELTKLIDFTKLTQTAEDMGQAVLDHVDAATSNVGGAVLSAGDSAGAALDDVTKRSKNLVHGIFGGGNNE